MMLWVGGFIATDMFGVIVVCCCVRACCTLLLTVAIAGEAVFWTLKVVEMSMDEYWWPLGQSFLVALLALMYTFGLCKGKAGSGGGCCGKASGTNGRRRK